MFLLNSDSGERKMQQMLSAIKIVSKCLLCTTERFLPQDACMASLLVKCVSVELTCSPCVCMLFLTVLSFLLEPRDMQGWLGYMTTLNCRCECDCERLSLAWCHLGLDPDPEKGEWKTQNKAENNWNGTENRGSNSVKRNFKGNTRVLQPGSCAWANATCDHYLLSGTRLR